MYNMVLETKSWNNNTKEISSKARRTAVTHAMKKKHAEPNLLRQTHVLQL